MSLTAIEIPFAEMSDYCRSRHIRRLAIFGSALRPDFRPDSDIDVLVEFESGHVPGLAFFAMQDDLARLFGRRVDLHTANSLSRHFRSAVLEQAETLYAAS